jgi:hypothetical protein
MSKSIRSFAIFAIFVLLAAALQPALAQPADNPRISFSKSEHSYISPATASALTTLAQMRAVVNEQRDSGIDVDALQSATPLENQTATDGDSLYDPVEAVLGTDFNNTDSDFDRLNDSYEARNNLDPLRLDSNDDGLADYFEVTNVSSLDLDGDNYSNAWDVDNDGDDVIDALDLSPFSKSTTHESFHFNITTNGNPAYVNFQLRPEKPDHLRQTLQTWDWPPDWEGSMKDTNLSKEDVHITPMLELTIPIECTISANHSGKCLEVFNASLDDGANIQQANCSNCSNQLWQLEHVGDGYYKIMANHSGKCLEVFNASLDDGANIQQANCSDCDNQLWKLEPVENVMPNQSLVEDYHIMINFNKIYIPLSLRGITEPRSH